MNKRIWLVVVIFWLGSFLAVFSLSALGVRKRIDVNQTIGDALYKFCGANAMGQTLTARNNNLNIIILDLKNPALKNKKPIFFRLREFGSTQDLRSLQINGFNIGDPSSVRFQFSPIPDSSRRQYHIILDSPESDEKERIEVYYSPGDVYPGGSMIINGKDQKGDLRFTSYYYPGSKKKVALETIAGFLKRFMEDKVFLTSYFGLLLLIFTVAIFI